MTSITPEEILALQKDPQRLLAEVARYQALRDELEAHGRGVVDEAVAAENKRRTELELAAAARVVETAKDQVSKMMADAKTASIKTINDARDEAERIVVDARVNAEKLTADASRLNEQASAERDKHEAMNAEMAAAESRAKEAAERHEVSRVAHERAVEDFKDIRQRLVSLVKGMREIVGDESGPTT